MPFVENLDMDRFGSTARQNAAQVAPAVCTRLDDCGSLESAQMRLAGLLWIDPQAVPAQHTALGDRCIKLAVRITRDVETAKDLFHEAFIATAREWRNVYDAQGFMFQAVTNLALNSIERKRAKGYDDITAISDAREAERVSYTPVVDAATKSLHMLLDMATKQERKIITMALAKTWDNLDVCPSLEAIAESVGLSRYELTQRMKALGLRAGVWTNEKRWFKQGAGSRRSQNYLRKCGANHVWSVLATFGYKSTDYNLWLLTQYHGWTVEHAGVLFQEMAKEHTGV